MSSSLLSVALVVSTDTGARILFAYPPNPHATPRLKTPIYHRNFNKDSQNPEDVQNELGVDSDDDDFAEYAQAAKFVRGEAGSQSSDGTLSLPSDSDVEDIASISHKMSSVPNQRRRSSAARETPEERHAREELRKERRKQGYHAYCGLPLSTLEALLAIRKEETGKKWEAVFNHLAFVAHPVWLGEDREPFFSRLPAPMTQSPQTLNTPAPDAVSISPSTETGGHDADIEDLADSLARNSVAEANVSRTKSFSSTTRSTPTRSVSASRSTSLSRSKRRTSSSATTDEMLDIPEAVFEEHVFVEDEEGNSHPASELEKPTIHPIITANASADLFAPKPHDRPVSPNSSTPSGLGLTRPPSSTSGLAPIKEGRASAYSPSSGSRSPRPKSIHTSDHIEFFSLVFIVDTPPDRHLTRYLDVYYQDAIKICTAAIKFEQKNSNWLTDEAEKIHKERESCYNSAVPYAEFVARAVNISTLCSSMASLFSCIRNQEVGHLSLGQSDISILIQKDRFEAARKPISRTTGPEQVGLLDGRLKVDMRNYKPWQTLLPLEDPAALMSDAEDPILRRFLEYLDPLLTFAEYEALLTIDAETICLICQHLVHWRKAIIIDAVSARNIYVPATKTAEKLHIYAIEFSQMFPNLPPLPSLLAMMSEPSRFSSLIPTNTSKSSWLSALIYLLRARLVVQLHQYYSLIVSPAAKQAARAVHLRETSGGFEAEFADSTNRERMASGNSFQSSQGDGDAGTSGVSSSTDGHSPLVDPLHQFTTNYQRYQQQNESGSAMRRIPTSHTSDYGNQDATSTSVNARERMHSALSGFSAGAWSSSSSALEDPNYNRPHIIADPSKPANELEEKYIAAIQLSAPEEYRSLFEQLKPFLDGRHHIDEIQSQTQIKLSQFREVCDVYEKHIITFVST